ncbi:mandelate racemase/muconate lactonizing enzyme family protein [Microbacterium marinilacus]|uniref:Dipeptide epimerase n=1 Tax=Microbacterium marinilacus TaxID=415209 RepID=A0ABP7B9B8_9MICO|nr:dipeptide epimerase [Microbacterium marinilacus]MBY0687239.1 dipeptide epimerase [Microbacterium marinilacus]
MAEIAEIRTQAVSVPLRRPFVTAVRRATTLDAAIVSVSDADGRVGWGEAALSWRVTGESADGARAVVEGPIAQALVGLPATEPGAWGPALAGAVAHNTAAKAAVDAALWDLAAQTAGVPVHRLLEPGSARETTTDMTLSAVGEATVLTDAREHVAAGFHVLKVKLGTDAAADDRVLRALRRGPAADVRLRVDANQGWSADEAIRLIRGWEEDGLGVELVEQPTPAQDVAALARVTRAVGTPILADESVWSLRDLRELVRAGAADLVNVKLAKTGGIFAARELIDAARDAGTDVLIGSMLETVVGITAAAHLAVTLPGRVHDLDAGLWQAGAPVDGGARYDGERVVLDDRPGLGIRGPRRSRR